jgi:hypothetical protein
MTSVTAILLRRRTREPVPRLAELGIIWSIPVISKMRRTPGQDTGSGYLHG